MAGDVNLFFNDPEDRTVAEIMVRPAGHALVHHCAGSLPPALAGLLCTLCAPLLLDDEAMPCDCLPACIARLVQRCYREKDKTNAL